ncbi:hypothetical protein BT93_L0505 [Corymbia citriodora subsp. variegata]|uniref:Methyltransferase type 11 domain-containing protein n=1 Tax=Corymbia citriodora subsp. variegata TaxID=360336 RepID=A0A8T0D0T8_CORYI|nr:hypothetical protein BT93_L0505 [Corymbia citriodora subsp. variegata]
MGFTMGLNLVLLMAMVATNILSLYHLSTTVQSPKAPPPARPRPPPPPAPHHTLHHQPPHAPPAPLPALRRRRQPRPAIPSDLLLHSQLAPIASACHGYPDLLHRNVIWAKYSCKSFSCLNHYNPTLGFDTSHESSKFTTYKSELDLPVLQLLQIAKSAGSVLRLGIDIGGGTGTFAATMKMHNVTVVTTTMNLGAPYNEAAALRGLVPLHVPLQQRLPMFDGAVDLVRCGHAVNRWIPETVLEFMLFDIDRVLRGGGYLWLDHFFGKGVSIEKVYKPLIGKLGYKKVKWATANKTDSSGLKNGEVYLTALLQKPVTK